MLQFLKFVLATIVGLFLFSFLAFLFVIVIGISASGDKKVAVDANSVLELKLDKPIAEREPKDPLAEFGFEFGEFTSTIGLNELKASIRKAKADENIKGIYLNVDLMSAGMATLEELRNELLDFKESGKFIVAYSEICSEKAYYLTSVADKFYLNPSGALELNGLSTEIMFFKGTFEKLDIEPYIFKVGEFKSAVEPFFRENMSDASRMQTKAFLTNLNDYYLQNVAKSLKKPVEELRAISDSMLVHNAEDALKHGLVTNLGYYDEALDYMKAQAGTEKGEELELVTLKDYKKAAGGKTKISKNKIAVVYADGDIVNGEGEEGNIGGARFAKAIREAREDKKVKAVVVRINSPGGSALASDIIWREIELTKKVKPVIASMGNVAASGGCYIAMACDTIVAHPNTITGSIGVFGMLFNAENFLQNKLGITVDRVKTGQFSDVPSVTRDMTEYEKKMIMMEVERIYEDFTSKAAKGRNMSQDELKKIASGRVWSGVEAKQNGLVDVFGGLEDAIAIAARKADLGDDYALRSLPKQKSFLDDLFKNISDDMESRSLQNKLGKSYPYYQAYQQLFNWQGVQARMPYILEVQ